MAAIGPGFSFHVQPLFAAQKAQKRLVMMGGRRTAGCVNRGRSDTELTGLVDAGLAGQNPVTLERFPLLAEKLPSVKNGQPAIEVILPALKNTLVLIITVVVIGKIVAVLLGIFSAMRQ